MKIYSSLLINYPLVTFHIAFGNAEWSEPQTLINKTPIIETHKWA